MYTFLYKNIIHLLIVILFLGSTAHAAMPAVSTEDFEFGACGSQMEQNANESTDHHDVPPCCAEKTDTSDQPLIQQDTAGLALVDSSSLESFSFFEYQVKHKRSFSYNNSHQKYFVLRI